VIFYKINNFNQFQSTNQMKVDNIGTAHVSGEHDELPTSFLHSKYFNALSLSAGAITGISSGTIIGTLFPLPIFGSVVGGVVGGAICGTIGSLAGLGIGVSIQSHLEPCKASKEHKKEKNCVEKNVVVYIPKEEMKRHSQYHPTLWISYHGKIYDVSDYVVYFRSKHRDLMDQDDDLVCDVEEMAGKLDCTEEFEKSALCMKEKNEILGICVGVLCTDTVI
jgi:predicted heme/steroid binding protein